MRLAAWMFVIGLCSVAAYGQSPTSHCGECAVIRIAAQAEANAVRIDHDRTNGYVYYSTIDGRIFELQPPVVGVGPVEVYSSADHGLGSAVLGFVIGEDGTMFIVGNDAVGPNNVATIMKGEKQEGGGRSWTKLAETEPYPRSATPFDHLFNGMAVSPDGAHLFVNSGSRTDHGEVQTNSGAFPDERESPITSAILRIPIDTTNLLIPNNVDSLMQKQFFFADGVRNSYDLAFSPWGDLFATENSGDRDDTEELNWIREGHHYGFPWRMGTSDTPQQFRPYIPASDPFINPSSYSASNGFFYEDPTYPPAPGIEFTDPVPNTGPDGVAFRKESDGMVANAADEGIAIGSFTPHRSPLGLAWFDGAIPVSGGEYCSAYVLSWTGSESGLLSPFSDAAEDLMCLKLNKIDDAYTMESSILVSGFDNPIDATLVDGFNLYVVEYGGGRGIWEIKLARPGSNETVPSLTPFTISTFPNPASRNLGVSITSKTALFVDFELFDFLGRSHSDVAESSQIGIGQTQLEIDTMHLPAGVYLLKVSGAGMTQTTPVVIVR